MASLTDVFTALQNGVTALNNLVAQAIGSFNNISSQLNVLKSNTRIRLTAALTLYVATNGNNSNDGLTPSTPFLTIQHAIDILYRNYDLAGQFATVQLADGTYTVGANASGQWTGGNNVTINGNSVTPANVDVNVAGGVFCFQSDSGAYLVVQNLRVRGASLLLASAFGEAHLQFANIDFGATAVGGVHCYVSRQSYMEALGSYSISGGAANHIQSSHGGNYRCAAVNCPTITVSANITFTQQTAYASSISDITFTGYASSPFSLGANTVIGQRYLSELCSLIQQLVSVNFFPGNGAGATQTGGNYI